MHLNWCICQQLLYLPFMTRQDWVAVLNSQGAIVGYVQGGWDLGDEWASFAMYFIAK